MKRVYIAYDKDLEEIISIRETELGARADIESHLYKNYHFWEWESFAADYGMSMPELEETLLKDSSLYEDFNVALYGPYEVTE